MTIRGIECVSTVSVYIYSCLNILENLRTSLVSFPQTGSLKIRRLDCRTATGIGFLDVNLSHTILLCGGQLPKSSKFSYHPCHRKFVLYVLVARLR